MKFQPFILLWVYHIHACIHYINSQSGFHMQSLQKLLDKHSAQWQPRHTADSPQYIWGFSQASLPPRPPHWSPLFFSFWTATARWSFDSPSVSKAKTNAIKTQHTSHKPYTALPSSTKIKKGAHRHWVLLCIMCPWSTHELYPTQL